MKKMFISILSAFAGAVFGAVAVGKMSRDKTQKIQSISDKHLTLYLMMNQWVKVKQEGKNLADYLEKNDYSTIAVYGMNYAGSTLINELKNRNITVKYGIDRNVDSIYADVDLVSVSDDLEPVDAVIVTAVTFFDEIETVLSGKVDCPILSLEDILFKV